jgi:phosphotriesterase-related protein
MARVNSVLGAIDEGELGFTLMHEHILVADWAMRRAFADWVERDALVAEAVRQLRAARERGVQSIVDATPLDLGRDIDLLREVSERAEMPIIAATGLYYYEPPWLQNWEVERIVGYLLRDIERGIQGSGSRAGIIKAATGPAGLTPANRKSLQIAARLQLASGLPITTHTEAAQRTGLAQQDLFEQEGVALGRVVIGHCGDTDDLDYLEGILRRGSLLGMDRFGSEPIFPTDRRIATVAALCQRGWADRLLLSHDHSCFIDWRPAEVTRARTPRRSFWHIADDILPALLRAGVTPEQVRAMTVTNPARLLGGAPAPGSGGG